MKKLVILFAAAVMMLPLAISCKKVDQPTTDVVMEPAATADVAKVVSFENLPMAQRPTYVTAGSTYEIVSVEFTEGSRYIMRRRPVATVTTKADAAIEVVTGKYTYSNGTYTCQGDFAGTVKPDTSSATVTPQGGQAQTSAAQVTNTSSSSTAQTNASRTWKVDNCLVQISGNGVSIDKSFTSGCNFEEIANYAVSNGVKNLDVTKLAGYKIDEFIFSGQNTMTIVFSGADNFYGKYNLSGSNFSYTLENGNDLMGVTATGTMTFPADKKAALTVSMGLKGYSGTIEFNLSQTN